jgi:hypothetical protein
LTAFCAIVVRFNDSETPLRKLALSYGAFVRLRNSPIVPPGGNQYVLCAESRLTYVFFTSGMNV